MLNPPIINAILSILLQRENLYGVCVDIFPSDFLAQVRVSGRIQDRIHCRSHLSLLHPYLV